MKKEALRTNKAPEAVGPYSQAIKANNLLFISMQIAIDPVSNQVLDGEVAEQTHLIFKNIMAILEAAGSGMDQVVKVTVFLKEMADFQLVNNIYAQYFDKPYPARSAVAVKELPKAVDIAIEVMAAL
jgi:2-iminobutanoate/2-iminopropanoate deaminase